MSYEPSMESLEEHEVPEWFHNGKLGIFVHWGLYSVPAFAVPGIDIKETVRTQGFEGQFENSPYAEWYLNSLRIEGSPTQEYHREEYGEDFTYCDFVPIFNEEIQKWNPEEMANLFERAGAKYVVLVTKHHDGFLLWPSEHPNPKRDNYVASRDIVGELTAAVKDKDLKMGFYYSGTFDWSFNKNPIKDITSFIDNGVLDPEYIEYANAHWYELIDKYEPKILWNDIGYPPETNVHKIFTYFYNKFPDGVINDRWLQIPSILRKLLKLYIPRKILKWITERSFLKGSASMPTIWTHCDFVTPEYGVFDKINEKKWEQTRGIGNSFGYNKFETKDDHISFKELIHMFVDLVSKNGNLLLNVGPMANGTIPKIQKKRLLQLGEWLEVNGDAIYGTRPWVRAEGETKKEIDVRFTQKGNSLYAIMLGKPEENEITIKSIELTANTDIELLSYEEKCAYTQKNNDVTIILPRDLRDSPAYSLKITPKPKNAEPFYLQVKRRLSQAFKFLSSPLS